MDDRQLDISNPTIDRVSTRRRFVQGGIVAGYCIAVVAPVSANQVVEQPSAIGGIGNTRTDINLAYGGVENTDVQDFGDFATDAVSYEHEWVFFLVENEDNPAPTDRAFIIHRYPEFGSPWAYPDAIALANQLLPADVLTTSDLVPHTLGDTVLEFRQSFSSESIARLFPNMEIYREGEPGTVWLVLTPDSMSSDPSNYFADVTVRLEHP